MSIPLIQPPNSCQATINIVEYFGAVFPVPAGPPTYNIQYFIGAVPLTGLININGLADIAAVQAAIDADFTYIAYQAAHPGTQIAITNPNPGQFQTVLFVPTTTTITGPFKGVFLDSASADIIAEAAFLCQLYNVCTCTAVANIQDPGVSQVQFTLGPNPVANPVILTGLIPISSALTIGAFQALIDADPTYIAYKAANPGTALQVLAFFASGPGVFTMNVIFTISTNVTLTNQAKINVTPPVGPIVTTLTPFICNFKDCTSFVCNIQRGGGRVLPDMIVFKKDEFPNGAPAKFEYKGRIYSLTHTNEVGDFIFGAPQGLEWGFVNPHLKPRQRE